jgi:AraC-like DNA-binding protein
MWVAFRPGAAYPFFRPPASTTADLLVPLDELWGGDGRVMRERLLEARTPAAKFAALEAVLLARAPRPVTLDPAIGYAVSLLERGSAVAAVAVRLGWTGKQLTRRFTERVGLTPKRFARVRRFQRLVHAVPLDGTADWARLAAEHGYHDQAHLVHEFRAFSGLAPTAYAPRSAVDRNHVPFFTSADRPAG